MGKAALILPEKHRQCAHCILFRFDGYHNCHYCAGVLGREVEALDHPDFCPLKQLPDKNHITSVTGHPKEYADGYRTGWNECLKAIERNGEDDERNPV